MSTDNTSRLRILLFTEQDIWVAQCLDFDIAAQGKDISNALDSLERVFVGQMILDQKRGRKPLERISPAPEKYWNRFEKGTPIEKEKKFRLPGQLEPAIANNMRIAA
jgi:hypothetical protein